jgi:hypothetical protein
MPSNTYAGPEEIGRLFEKVKKGVPGPHIFLSQRNELKTSATQIFEYVRENVDSLGADFVRSLDDLIAITNNSEFKGDSAVVRNRLRRSKIEIAVGRSDLIPPDWIAGIKQKVFLIGAYTDPNERIFDFDILRLYSQKNREIVDEVLFKAAADFALVGSKKLTHDERKAAYETFHEFIKQQKKMLTKEQVKSIRGDFKSLCSVWEAAGEVCVTIQNLRLDFENRSKVTLPKKASQSTGNRHDAPLRLSMPPMVEYREEISEAGKCKGLDMPSNEHKEQGEIRELFNKVKQSVDGSYGYISLNNLTKENATRILEYAKENTSALDEDFVKRLNELIAITSKIKSDNVKDIRNRLRRAKIEVAVNRTDLVQPGWIEDIKKKAFLVEPGMDPNKRLYHLGIICLYDQRYPREVDRNLFNTAIDFALEGSKNLTLQEQLAGYETLHELIKQHRDLLTDEQTKRIRVLAKDSSPTGKAAGEIRVTLGRELPPRKSFKTQKKATQRGFFMAAK